MKIKLIWIERRNEKKRKEHDLIYIVNNYD